MVPAIGILVPERSVWHPSTGTLSPDPIGSGYSIPSRAGTHLSEPGRGISPGLSSTGHVSGLERKKENVTGAHTIYSISQSIPSSFYAQEIWQVRQVEN